MSPEGKPIQVNASALNTATAQTTIGIIHSWAKHVFNLFCTGIVSKQGSKSGSQILWKQSGQLKSQKYWMILI